MQKSKQFAKLSHILWMYRILGYGTIFYGLLGLAIFFLKLTSMSFWFTLIWSVSLIGYSVLNKALQEVGLSNSGVGRRGEFYAIFIIVCYFIMEFFNKYLQWVLNKEPLLFPEGFPFSAIEALVLLILSWFWSLRIHCKNNNNLENKE